MFNQDESKYFTSVFLSLNSVKGNVRGYILVNVSYTMGELKMVLFSVVKWSRISFDLFKLYKNIYADFLRFW